MDATLWIVLFEDILFLVIIGVLLYLRQRPYTILAAMLFAIIVLANIVVLRILSTWFILVLPLLLSTALVVIARPFLPPPRNQRMTTTIRYILAGIMTVIALAVAVVIIKVHTWAAFWLLPTIALVLVLAWFPWKNARRR
jgi:hypothetical protein